MLLRARAGLPGTTLALQGSRRTGAPAVLRTCPGSLRWVDRLERDDFSSNHRPALALCLSMIFFRKPVPTFRDHALGPPTKNRTVQRARPNPKLFVGIKQYDDGPQPALDQQCR